MATFVLVHGAWGGAHGFRYVRHQLLDLGHDVHTPALTGQGERSHLLSPQVTLQTHVEDLSNLLFYWDLRDVVLVGHSYGGVVITAALRSVADRVAHLVYLDAFVPADGESLDDMAGANWNRPDGTPWLILPLQRAAAHPEDDEDAAFAAARRGPQPARTLLDPVSLEQPLEAYPFTRTYIKATADPRPDPPNAFWMAADRAQASPDWRYREIAADHGAPTSHPDGVVKLLLELV
jgi:pimeloyl-ACP methyl ester carboxylesterase